MAHAIFLDEAKKRSMAVTVYSAGVFDFSDAPALAETSRTCLQNETPPPKENPTYVGQLPINSIDRFLVMEQDHADILSSEFGVAAQRISLLGTFDPRQRGREIADPFGRGARVYDRCYQLIRDCIIGYLETTDELNCDPRVS